MDLLTCFSTITFLFVFVVCFLVNFGLSGTKTLKLNKFSSELDLSISFLVGSTSVVLLIVLGKMFNMSGEGISGVLLLLATISVVINRTDLARVLCENRKILIFWFLFVLAFSISVLNPNLEITKFVLSDVQAQFALPIDNLIPFQTVRYITENISPNLIDPVPNWKFGDRGPFFGILISAFFLILNIKENLPWLSSSYPSAAVFEFVGVILNLFFIVPLFAAIKPRFGLRTAYLSLFLLVLNPYIYINTVFTWPKLFAASFVVLSLDILFNKQVVCDSRKIIFSSCLLSLGFLVHENLVFNFLGFSVIILRQFKLRHLFYFFGVFIILNLPWIVYKKYSGQVNANLMLYNAFCIEVASDHSGVMEKIFNSFKSHTPLEYIKIKFDNIFYPLNPFYLDWRGIFRNFKFQRLIQFTTSILFYQFIYAFGLLPSLYIIVRSLIVREANQGIAILLFLSSILSVGLFQGCPLSTWNHIWAFFPFIGLTGYFAISIIKEKRFIRYSVLGLHLFMVLSYLMNYVWFPPRSQERFVGFSLRENSLGLILFLILIFAASTYFHKPKRSEL